MNLLPSDFLPILAITIYFSLSTQRHHFLMILLFLEAAILTLTLSLFMSMNHYFSFYPSTFAACEAALGLACLVKLTHAFGSDLIQALSMNKC
uniref:NADH dehydrogenase subunit 4L n=1 Tax=Orbinia latreillii TaxID=195264 RepID=Q1X8Y4_9ANNE|nr:NADH dehydrogenase subunit 4L [Orbinia latreillii]AAX50147.1 NADH dehydrogenase subunit 4L [Orbinia latreillii]